MVSLQVRNHLRGKVSLRVYTGLPTFEPNLVWVALQISRETIL